LQKQLSAKRLFNGKFSTNTLTIDLNSTNNSGFSVNSSETHQPLDLDSNPTFRDSLLAPGHFWAFVFRRKALVDTQGYNFAFSIIIISQMIPNLWLISHQSPQLPVTRGKKQPNRLLATGSSSQLALY
jgi:hypothetical protein